MLSGLEGFYWVVRTGGYARAARAFPYPITQPGVHRQVRRLELELEVRLVERVGKDRVVATPEGQVLYAFVAPFLERLGPLAQGLRHKGHGGLLRIAAAGLLVRQLLPAWLRRLQAKRPDIRVALTELRRSDLAPLRSGEVELWVDHLAAVPPDVEAVQVGWLHTFLALPGRHPLAARARVALRELRALPFIAYNSDAAVRDLQQKALALYGGGAQETLSAETADALLGFVAAGLGFSIVPWPDAVGPRMSGVAVRPFRVPGARFPVYAAWRRGVENGLVRAAVDWAPRPSAWR